MDARLVLAAGGSDDTVVVAADAATQKLAALRQSDLGTLCVRSFAGRFAFSTGGTGLRACLFVLASDQPFQPIH